MSKPFVPDPNAAMVRYQVVDLERAITFYTESLGFTIATNSAGDPGQAQGFSVNLYGFDEDLATSGWYEEALGRIADCGGKIRWSALPHAKNEDMMQLITLAEEQAEKPQPVAVIFRALANRPPFVGDPITLLQLATRGERPSLHALRPDLPPNVDFWVQAALAISPDERFDGVAGMWNAFKIATGLKPAWQRG